MKKDCNVIVIIPTGNNFEKFKDIESTVESVLSQTILADGSYSNRLKIAFIDNGSTDGTYEKIIDLVSKDLDNLAVFRLSKETKKTRVFQNLTYLLRYSSVKYSMILNPGDFIIPSCIEKCISVFENTEGFRGDSISFEVDIKMNGDLVNQTPIYESTRVICENNRKEHLISNTDHRLISFFKRLPITANNHLMELVEFTNFHEWFYKFFYIKDEMLYLSEKLGVININILSDPIEELFNRYLLISRNSYLDSFDTNDTFLKTKSNIDSIYAELINLSFYYAKDQIKIGRIDMAKRCLLFAEMIDLEAKYNPKYEKIKKEIYDLDY